MIDGFKAKVKGLPAHDPPLNWKVKVCEQTGEELSRTAWLDGLYVVQKKGRMFLKGSIHKYHNRGDHNYNNFLYPDIQASINRICKLLDLKPSEVELENLEFGYNLVMEKNPASYLSALIMHKRKPFSFFSQRATKGKSQERCCVHDEYQIKGYDKGLQYGVKQNILRIEVSVNKMRFLKKHGVKITTLADLQPENLYKLDEVLRDIVGEILFCDRIPDNKSLSKSAIQILYAGRDADYWFNLFPRKQHEREEKKDVSYASARIKYYRRQKRFIELVEKYGLNQCKREVVSKLEEQSKELLSSMSAESVYKITDENVTEKPAKCIQNHREVIGGNCKCLVTGLDISMQKPGSRFLCAAGIRHYMDSNPEVYQKLRERLSPRWFNAPHDIQIQEIHHSIRNEYFNKIHNTRRSINRIFKQPLLFDIEPFLTFNKVRHLRG